MVEVANVFLEYHPTSPELGFDSEFRIYRRWCNVQWNSSVAGLSPQQWMGDPSRTDNFSMLFQGGQTTRAGSVFWNQDTLKISISRAVSLMKLDLSP